MKSTHTSNTSKQNDSIQKHQSLKGLLIDLDGTLYHGSAMIEGADRLIHWLNDIGLQYLFVTNNSASTPEQVAERLRSLGIPAFPEQVCTSAEAAAHYVSSQSPGASVFVIGEQGLREAISGAGCKLVEEDPAYVVQGIDRYMTYDRMAKAVAHLRNGAVFLLTNPDLLLPANGGLIPGAGSIGAMLEAASGMKPIVIGKPSRILMNYAMERLGAVPEETWVIGDNLATDIAAGVAAGCGTALVLTGLTNRGNLEKYAAIAGCKPDLICDDLELLRAAIKQKLEL